MIDYLLRFPDPAAALTAFSMPEAVEGAAPPPAWSDERSRAVMPVQVYRVLDPGDEDTPATLEHAEGFWLAVATTAPDDELWAHPATVHETDREAAARGEQPILRTHFTQEQLGLNWKVTPVWAGSDYGF